MLSPEFRRCLSYPKYHLDKNKGDSAVGRVQIRQVYIENLLEIGDVFNFSMIAELNITLKAFRLL